MAKTQATRGSYAEHFYPGTEELGAGEMRITALGTGRPFLRRAQANASWLIELGNGDKFVFDFGFGSVWHRYSRRFRSADEIMTLCSRSAAGVGGGSALTELGG